MSTPIERLIDHGCTEILEAGGWYYGNVGGSLMRWTYPGINKRFWAEEATPQIIQLAGMAALEWLSSRGPWKSGQKAKYRYCISTEAGDFEAPTLDEAAIDAACAVKEASRGN